MNKNNDNLYCIEPEKSLKTTKHTRSFITVLGVICEMFLVMVDTGMGMVGTGMGIVACFGNTIWEEIILKQLALVDRGFITVVMGITLFILSAKDIVTLLSAKEGAVEVNIE